MNAHTLVDAMQLFPVVLIGVILPMLGRARRGVLFGVTVPVDFASSAIGGAAMRRYRKGTIVVAAVTILACTAALLLQGGGARVAVQVCVVVQLAAAFLLWQRERRVILPYAIVAPLERSAGLTPGTPSGPLFAAAALLPVAATALWLHRQWALIPARWPRHWNAAGQVNGWGVRTAASVYFPLAMGVAVVLLFLTILAVMVYAPGAQSRQRARILAPMATLAWAMSLLFCSMALQPLMHLNGDGAVLGLVGLHMVAILGVLIWLVVRTGFGGADSASETASEPYDGTPDARWYGGVIYYNPADAAVVVPKRYGWGWTLNFARPVTWVFTLLIVGFAVFSAWLPRLLR